METLRISISMAVILRVPTAMRCCMIPVRMASLSLGCFLHPPPTKSAAASPKAKAIRFMRESFPNPGGRFISSILRRPKPVGNHWQIVEANASGIKDGIADGRRHSHDGSFARARRRKIFPVQQYRLDFRHVAEPRHAIAGEMRVLDAAVFKFDR